MSIFKKITNPIFTMRELSEQPEVSEHPTDSIGIVDSAVSEGKFWSVIDKIQWVDESDHKMNIAITRSKLTTYLSASELIEFKIRLRKYMDDLRENMKKYDYPNTNDEFLSHIVGKGKIFYYSTLKDPEFATYLLDGDTQNFWSILDK